MRWLLLLWAVRVMAPRADGERFEEAAAGEFASMDEQTAREALRNMTGRKARDLRWGSGAKRAVHGNLHVGDDPAPASAGVDQVQRSSKHGRGLYPDRL